MRTASGFWVMLIINAEHPGKLNNEVESESCTFRLALLRPLATFVFSAMYMTISDLDGAQKLRCQQEIHVD